MQISLPIRLQEWASLDNFFLPEDSTNQALLASLASADWRVIYMHGKPGTGKTHLLQASCRYWQETRGSQVIYLPLSELVETSTVMLDGLDQFDLVAMDELEAIAGKSEWEEAVFHLFNAIQLRGAKMLFAGESVPGELPLGLADLRSRVLSGTTWKLELLAEADLRHALLQRAERLGLLLSPQVLDYLFTRYSRDAKTLFALLDRLDNYAFNQQRQITLPLIRSYLQESEGS